MAAKGSTAGPRELYHAAISTCSQKVRLVLAEKGLDWTGHELDLVRGEQHDPAYVKLNPGHVVPTLIDAGRVLVESTLVNEYLDEAYPEPALRPEDPLERHAMRLWTKRVDEKVHPHAATITYGIGTRPALLRLPEERREAMLAGIPDPARRAARASVIEHGVEAPEMAGAMRAFVSLLDDVDEALGDGRAWLAGERFSLADAAVLPYVLRLDHLAMTWLWADGARPRLAEWYAGVQARPAYAQAVADWLPEAVVTSFRANGEAVRAEVERHLA